MRILGVARKEFIQIRRNKATFLWLFMIPILQIFLFGYVINSNPKHLPTAVISSENTPFTRSLLEGFKQTTYFSMDLIPQNELKAEESLIKGDVQFVINIPPNFTREVIRGESPHVLIEADASDPVAVVNAYYAAVSLPDKVLNNDLRGSLQYLRSPSPPFYLDVQSKYNPEIIPQYNTLPGLIALLIFTTLTVLTAISITAEFEAGTFETLLTTPLSQLNIIFGKLIPHFIFGYIILFMLLGIAIYFFEVPFYGNFFLYLGIMAPYSIANLGTGLAISTISRTQFQAASSANAYLLTCMIISGFLFPFKGMPLWAQYLGEIVPLTHFLRITRNIMLKGADLSILWQDIWPIIVFMIAIISLSIFMFKKTLD
jgi:ABC-2 type transport system permease protein